MWREQDTIAAIATPPGEGGIAIIRLSGSEAHTVAAQIFRPRRAVHVALLSGYTACYGRFIDAASDEVADDGLLTVFRAPHSYTGEHAAELSCHGGRVTPARVLRLALDAGARLAEPGEFTRRAFLNGRLDLAQAEAVGDLIRARTEAARRLARRQLDGALSRTVQALRQELIGALAAIEVTIDFSEEVGELDYPTLLARLTGVREQVDQLLETAEQGRLVREGLRVAIVGRPNVGKSSLLNGLLRADRAIVTPIAGTTRDLLEETANVAGIPVVLIDTAGLRETADPVEQIGVERAQRTAQECDVALFVLDATAGIVAEDRRLMATLPQERTVIVANKSDLLSPARMETTLAQIRDTFRARDTVALSALTGSGLETLEAALATLAWGGSGAAVTTESVVVAAARHRQALEAAGVSLREAERTTVQGLPGDFIAIDARGALEALGQITGESVTDEIIHRIFHDFCVGK